MTLSNRDKRIHINELQFLQREINLLQVSYAKNPDPLIGKSISNLQAAQDKLYSSLARHGVTAQDIQKIISETNDKNLVKTIRDLQNAKRTTEKRLENPNLSPKHRQSLEHTLSQTLQQYSEKWRELTNHPNKSALMKQIEKAQIKAIQKEHNRDRDKSHEQERSH